MSTMSMPFGKIKVVVLSVFCSFVAHTLIGQQTVVVDSYEYQQLKQTGGLDNVQVQPVSMDANGIQINPEYFSSGTVRTSDCDCYRQPDASYTLAMGPNDDGSSAQITLPFQFCFYGEQRTTLHINNNGNVSFAGPISTFSANAFPSNGNVMVAPFWGDVDTRGIGQVWYKITPTAIYVNWENVGYFNQQTDKTNTFQLILTNGADPAVPNGGNIAFCYGDMQWTTGSASQGVNGFGGVPATVGANRGNNVNFFQIGRFDHPGTDYNGANIPSGVSWLDNKTFYFDICNSTNVPPIASGVAACDTFKICALGDTADFVFTFLSPELNQTTQLTFNNGGNPDIFMVNSTTGNTAEIVIRAIGSVANAGYHTVSVTATDDGVPTGVTTISFVIQIDDSAVDLLNPQLSQPQSSCSAIPVSVLNGPYDSYLWDDLSSTPSTTVSQTGTVGVTVSLNGCYKRVEADFEIFEPAFFNLQGVPFVCPGVSQGTFLYAGDSISLNSMTWGLSDPQLNQLFSNYLFEGTYNLNLVDTNGCVRDTVLTIDTQPKIILNDYATYCMDSHALTGNTGVNTGAWYTINSPSGSSFASNNLNTTITVTQSGTYTLVYAEDHCDDSDTTTIIFVDPRPFGFDSDFHICPGEAGEFLALADSSNYASITWGLSNPVLNAQFSNTLQAGTYTVSKLDAFGCENDTTFTITTQSKIVLAQYGVICNDTLSLFQNTGVNTGSWSTIPSGFNLTFQSNEVNTTANAGQFGTVQIIYSENVCNDADTTTVEFNRPPYTQILDSTLCAGTVYQMYALNYPQNANYAWSTGATGTTVIAVDQPGEYFVSVTNSCGTHSDTAIVVYITCDFEVPNVFTPNGDGTNDFFKLVEYQGLKNFTIVILNRWGNVMREFSEPDFQWDGTDKNGNAVTEGVYFYRVQTETFNGEPLEKHGFVQLIRE